MQAAAGSPFPPGHMLKAGCTLRLSSIAQRHNSSPPITTQCSNHPMKMMHDAADAQSQRPTAATSLQSKAVCHPCSFFAVGAACTTSTISVLQPQTDRKENEPRSLIGLVVSHQVVGPGASSSHPHNAEDVAGSTKPHEMPCRCCVCMGGFSTIVPV